MLIHFFVCSAILFRNEERVAQVAQKVFRMGIDVGSTTVKVPISLSNKEGQKEQVLAIGRRLACGEGSVCSLQEHHGMIR